MVMSARNELKKKLFILQGMINFQHYYCKFQQLITLLMDLHQSPIKIVSHVNIPEVKTPLSFRRQSTIKGEGPRGITKILETKRAEVILLKDSKQYECAFRKADELIRLNPKDLRNYQIKGQLAFLLKYYEQALQIYQQLIDLSNSTQNIQQSYFHSQINLDFDKKQAEHKRMRAYYLYNKGLCLQKLGKFNDAIQVLKQCVEINKNKVEAFILMAQVYRQMKNYEKVFKIYRKILTKNPQKSEYLFKVIKICCQEKQFVEMLNFVDEGILWWSSQSAKFYQNGIVVNSLYKNKGDALKKMEKYNQAIEAYTFVIHNQLNEAKLIKIYRKMALCFDFIGDLAKSCEFYKKTLLLNQNSIETVNNLANVLIRRGQYQQALNILNSGILKLLAFPPNNESIFAIMMLRSHRVIAFTKLNLICEARQDLNEIMVSIGENNMLEVNQAKQWQNYNFIRFIINRYQHCISRLSAIKKEDNYQNEEEIKCIEKELVCSITQELEIKSSPIDKFYNSQSKEPNKNNNLEQLSARIDRLYSEIVSFKKTALQQHTENTNKVHNKIAEIQIIMTQKQEAALKLQRQLEEMKREYQNIYNFIIQQKQNSNSKQFTHMIDKLRSEGKHQVISYIQKMYWIFNAYFISIRLIANRLVVQQSNNIHINKIASFFSKFKQVFQSLSKVPHIGIVCQIITAIMSLYLSEQSNMIYNSLNKIITHNYFLQTDLQKALQTSLINLVLNSNYIEEALREHKKCSIAKQMSSFNKAQEWFQSKKNKLIERLFKVPQQQSFQQKVISDLVIEDVSSVFVYLVKNKQIYLTNYVANGNVLIEAIDKSLSRGFKNLQISSLYARDARKQTKMGLQEQSCSKCMIYLYHEEREVFQIDIPKNVILNQLIGDAIKQNNMELFNYAIGQLNLQFC